MNRTKPANCSGCVCEQHGTDFTQIEGTGSLGVLVCAEASGEMEARDGLPLRAYAPAGSILERAFRRMGLDRKQFSITNTIRCRPRNNWLEGAPWEYSALRHCRPNLDAAIAERLPRAILALGNIPTRELTGMAGDAQGVGHLAGYILRGPNDIPVCPTFHPAFIRRGKASYQGLLARNIQRAVNVAQGRDRAYLWNVDPSDRSTHAALTYQTHPSLDAAEGFAQRVLAHPNLTLSYDLETFESSSLDEDARDGFTDTHIRLIQFSLAADEGIAFPWEGRFRDIAARILRGTNVKCGHNVWLFDNKVLAAAGQREGLDLTPCGTIRDTLQMFHHWQPDLPAHLQFCAQWVQFPFPWKHLAGSDLEFYGCCDADATGRLHDFLEAALKRDGIWDGEVDGQQTLGYVGQVEQVRPVLAAMEDRGLPVDDAERLKLDGEFDIAQQELLEVLDARFPDGARSIHPKEGYKKQPKDISGLVLRGFGVAAIDEASGEPVLRTVERWCRLEAFSPNSSQQLVRYMKARGHKVPKAKETDDEGREKDTTAKKELVRLAHKSGDDFYLKVIEYRELSKMRGTYIEGFKPHADGFVRTTFTFDTGIGQLSCCAAWTPVLTERGTIPIEQVVVGDRVWTHRKRWRKVTATWIHPPDEMTEVQFSNGQVLTCTASHKLLCSGNVDKQGMGNSRKCERGLGSIPQSRSSDGAMHLSEVGHLDSYSDLDTLPENVCGGVWSIEKAPLLTLEDGSEESNAWADRFPASYVDWYRGGWLRLSDLLSGWKASVCASTCDGTNVRSEVPAAQVGGSSYRRRHKEQHIGQSGSRDQRRTQVYPLTSADGGEVISIEEAIPVGRLPVYDITVEEDASYETCGVFSHNSRNPNIQNFPKHGRLAKATRRMIAAKSGNILVEWDYKSCHVLTLGFLAEDPNYVRIARLDMHSFVTGHKLGLWHGPDLFKEPDDVLRVKFKWLKSNPEWKHIRDARMKHAILGIGNGLKARGLFEKHMEDFDSQKQAQGFLDVIEELFPKEFAWHKKVQDLAHQQQFLKTQYGHMRRFYEVYRWDAKKGGWGHGDQHEEAISYWLSNIAFGYIREHMKDVDRLGLAERYGMCNNVHDSLLFHFPADQLEQHVRAIYPVLVRPTKVLTHPEIAPDGLYIDCEAAAGRNWSEMDEVDIKSILAKSKGAYATTTG